MKTWFRQWNPDAQLPSGAYDIWRSKHYVEYWVDLPDGPHPLSEEVERRCDELKQDLKAMIDRCD